MEDQKLKRVGELIDFIPLTKTRIKVLEGEIRAIETVINGLSDKINSTGYSEDGGGYFETARRGGIRNGSANWCRERFPEIVRGITLYGEKILELNRLVLALRDAENELAKFNLKMGI